MGLRCTLLCSSALLDTVLSIQVIGYNRNYRIYSVPHRMGAILWLGRIQPQQLPGYRQFQEPGTFGRLYRCLPDINRRIYVVVL